MSTKINSISHINNVVVNTGTVGGSIINSSSGLLRNNDMRALRSVLEHIRDSLPEIQLAESLKSELQIELQTVNLQIESPKPKKRIIQESLSTIRKILEGTASKLLADAIKPFLL